MQLLSDLFTLNSSILDTRISKSLIDMTTAVINGSPLMLTAMGRKSGALNSGIEKHLIKRAARSYFKNFIQYVVKSKIDTFTYGESNGFTAISRMDYLNDCITLIFKNNIKNRWLPF